MECFRHFQRNAIGIHPVGPALTVKAQRRDDGNDPLLEEKFKGMVVDSLYPSRKELVCAPENAGWMSDDRIGIGSS